MPEEPLKSLPADAKVLSLRTNETPLMSLPSEAKIIGIQRGSQSMVPHINDFGVPDDSDKTEEIINRIDLDENKKDILRDLVKKRATTDEFSQAIGTLQGKHPHQDGTKYYLNDRGVPMPLKNNEKPPHGYDVASIWGTQKEADDDHLVTSLAKHTWNGLVGAAEGLVSLGDVTQGLFTGEESTKAQTLKNAASALKFDTPSYEKDQIFDSTGMRSASQIFDPERYNFTANNVQGQILNGLESVLSFAVGTKGLGTVSKAAKGAKAGLSGLEGAAASTAINASTKAETKALAAISAYNMSLTQMLDVADEAGLKGRDKYAFVSIASVPQALLESTFGAEGLLTRNMAAKAEYKNLAKIAAQNLERNEAGELTKESLEKLHKEMLVAATATNKTFGRQVAENVGEEMLTETAQQFAEESSKQLYDKLSEDPKFNADAFSPKSIGKYVNAAIGGALGSVGPSMVFTSQSRNIEKDKAKNESVFEAVKKGDDAVKALKHNIQNSDLTEEEKNDAITKVNAYKVYNDITASLPLDDSQKKEAFDKTFQKENLETRIEAMGDPAKLHPLKKAEYAGLEKQANDLQKDINDIILQAQVMQAPTLGDKTLEDIEKKEEAEKPKPGENKKKPSELAEAYKNKHPGRMVTDTRTFEQVPAHEYNSDSFNARRKHKITADYLDERGASGVIDKKGFTHNGKGNATFGIMMEDGKRISFSSSMKRIFPEEGKGEGHHGHFRIERFDDEVAGTPVGLKVLNVPNFDEENTSSKVIKAYRLDNGKFVGWAKETKRGTSEYTDEQRDILGHLETIDEEPGGDQVAKAEPVDPKNKTGRQLEVHEVVPNDGSISKLEDLPLASETNKVKKDESQPEISNLDHHDVKIVDDEAENKLALANAAKLDNPQFEPNIQAAANQVGGDSKIEVAQGVKGAEGLIDAATGVVNLPVKEIFTDEKRFQNREELDKDLVKQIAENFNENQFDPIVVWKDNFKTYVLAGHHRFEGAKQAGKKSVKVRYFNGTEAQAIEFAKVKSNANRTLENPVERAKIYRDKINRGESKKSVSDSAKENEGKNASFYLNIASLKADGPVTQAYNSFKNSQDKVAQREIDKIMDWIGEVKRQYDLTDQHEQELFTFLTDKEASKRIQTKGEFKSKISSIVDSLDFDRGQSLNIARFKNKTEGEKVYDKEVSELKAKIDHINKNEIPSILKRFSEPSSEGYVSPENPEYDKMKYLADEKVNELNNKAKKLSKDLQDLYREKGKYVNSGSNQESLFEPDLEYGEEFPTFEYNEGTKTYESKKGEKISFNSIAGEPSDAEIPGLFEEENSPKDYSDRVTWMERQLNELPYLSLTGGTQIKSTSDVAFLFRHLESAVSENTFTVMIRPDGTYNVLYTTTGGTAATLIDAKLIYAAAKEFQASKVCFVHNHPSGNLVPSPQDHSVHEKLTTLMGIAGIELMPSVIINLDTGKYSEFQSTSHHASVSQSPAQTQEVKVYQFDKQILYTPSSEKIRITNSKSIAKFLSTQKRGIVPKLGIIVIDRANAINKYIMEDSISDVNTLADKILTHVGKSGENVILVTNSRFDKRQIKEINDKIRASGATILDAIEVEPSADIEKNYRSFNDDGVMEPGAQYQTKSKHYFEQVPIEELLPYIEIDKNVDLEEIEASIDDNGFKNPVVLKIGHDGKGLIVDGAKRIMAAKNLGVKKVPVRILEGDLSFSESQKAKPMPSLNEDERVGRIKEKLLTGNLKSIEGAYTKGFTASEPQSSYGGFDYYREKELGHDVDEEAETLSEINRLLKDPDTTEEEHEELLQLKEAIEEERNEAKKSYKEYRNKKKILDKINEAKDLEGFTFEELVDAYNFASNSSEQSEAKLRLGVYLNNIGTERLSKIDPSIAEKVNTKDFSWLNKWMKVLSNVTEKFPALQELHKVFEEKYLAKVQETNKIKAKHEKLGKAVIKEKNRGLGLMSDLFSSDSAKYFEYLDDGGKLRTNTNGLSKAQKEYLEFIQELVKDRNEILDDGEVVDNTLIKIDKGFQETLRSEGYKTAILSLLPKKSEDKLNWSGALTSRFDRPYKGKSYSKDFYKAANLFIEDVTHVKYMKDLVPVADGIEAFYRQIGYEEKKNFQNVIGFIEEWKKSKLYQEQGVTDPKIDAPLRFLRGFVSTSVMAFNVPANFWNVVVGNASAIVKDGGKTVALGLKRMTDKKGMALLKHYDVVKTDYDSNPKAHAGQLFQTIAFAGLRLGEIQIQGSHFLGKLTEDEYNNVELINGELVINAPDKKEFDHKMIKYKNEVSDIQGKYGDKDKFNATNYEFGKALLQFKLYLPSFFKDKFGAEFINSYGETKRGTFNYTKKAIEELKTDWAKNGYLKGTWENQQTMASLKYATVVATFLILSFSDDDDEDKRRKAYSLDNALGNMLSVFDPRQMKYLVSSPVAAQGPVTKFLDAFMAIFQGDEKKFKKNAKKLIPYGKLAELPDQVTK